MGLARLSENQARCKRSQKYVDGAAFEDSSGGELAEKAGIRRARPGWVLHDATWGSGSVQGGGCRQGPHRRVPGTGRQVLNGRAYNELSSEMEREPADEDVAGRLGWSIEDVRDLKVSLWDASSLNEPLSSDADATEIGELIEDERASEVAGTIIGEMEMDWLAEVVEKLPERHRYVLIKRYGLGDQETATLAQLSEELGISRERVRQLQREAERMLAGGEYGRAIGLAA